MLMALCVQSASGQRLNFVTSTPKLDSFPVVRFHMTASYNGSLPVPSITPADISIKEDGKTMTPMLSDCDESELSAVVFCVDVSTSMISSVGDGFDISNKFFDCFAPCINELRVPSRYALVTFTDAVAGVYPGAGHPSGFYIAGNSADSDAFSNAIRTQPYFGGTYVDAAIDQAVSMLQYQPFKERAIVLVTDDAVLNFSYYDSLMELYHITLYVMEVGTDNSPHDVFLAHETGGTYFQAQDSIDFAPVMSQLGELISSEHCTLRYISTNPCPWFANHMVNMSLTYNGLTRTSDEYYSLAANKFDTDGPDINVTLPSFTSRAVDISENFPCERGLMFADDSLFENFLLLKRRQTFSHYFPKVGGVYRDSSYMSLRDSIVVRDSMFAARAIYLARDSAGNRSGIEILYSPKSDVLPPVVTVSQSSGGKYVLGASEVRPWDRGLVSISLQPGATNLVFDSSKLYSKRIGNAWVHVVDLTQPAHGCIQAIDTAGNVGVYCIDRGVGVRDTLPPVIRQNPVVSPFKYITGEVTEQRQYDVGLNFITIPPAGNTSTQSTVYISPFDANFSVEIVDSLQPVRALITASDSLGNAALDTLRYDPLPDTAAPVATVVYVSPTVRTFRATEFLPWDRGIESVAIIGIPNNMSVGATNFISRFEADRQFTVSDPTKVASVVVSVTDSAKHETVVTITISPTVIPLVPFKHSGNVDFLTHLAPFDSTADIVITNPNEVPVIVTKLSQTGDVGVVTTDATMPLIVQPFNQVTIHLRLKTGLIGVWQSTVTLSNDTIELATVTSVGTTTGLVHISIDTARPAHSQLPDTLVISVAATPNPINLDTLSFDVTFDGDLIQSYLPIVDCSGTNPICNYDVQFSRPVKDGVLHFLLSRKDRSLLSALSLDTAKIRLPFITFVSKYASSPVVVSNMSSPLTELSFDSGLVSIGDQCGDPTIRAFLNNRLDAVLSSVVPNPASAQADVIVTSSSANASVVLTVVDALGNGVRRIPLSLTQGANTVTVPLSDLPSGSYRVVLGADGSERSSMPLVILH